MGLVIRKVLPSVLNVAGELLSQLVDVVRPLVECVLKAWLVQTLSGGFSLAGIEV